MFRRLERPVHLDVLHTHESSWHDYDKMWSKEIDHIAPARFMLSSLLAPAGPRGPIELLPPNGFLSSAWLLRRLLVLRHFVRLLGTCLAQLLLHLTYSV